MLFASDFHRDPVGVDPEAHAHDGLDMSLFERGGALDAPNLCLPPYARASSYSPTFPVDIHARHGHGHSDSGLGLQVSQSDDDYSDRFPQSTLATDNFRDDFCMAANYPYLSNPCSDTHQFSSELYCISPASSETTDTTSSASCHAEMFSNAQSTPETARPHLNFTHTMPSFPRSNAQYGPQTHPTNGSQNFPRPVNHWSYAPSALPSISQNRRCSASTPSSPATWHIGLGGTFGQFPVAEDVHRWPQLFKINQVKKVGVKKQVLACLFCRERKIACFRPPADHPDQTCNQCARRKRTCKYPTESRRGQHTRNRYNTKKFLGYEETKVAAPTALSRDP